MTGPYRVEASAPETVIVDCVGEYLTVTNYVFIHHPNREVEDPKRQNDSDDITMSPDPDSLDDDSAASAVKQATSTNNDTQRVTILTTMISCICIRLSNVSRQKTVNRRTTVLKLSFFKTLTRTPSKTPVTHQRHARLPKYPNSFATATATYLTELNLTTICTPRIYLAPMFRT